MTDNTPGESSDLFIDLYTYRQRENKDPLEDWLTECLAVTIRALPRSAKAALLGKLSGAEPNDIEKYDVEVLTQYAVPAVGRPDMLVKLDSFPWLLFENKVSHGVAVRESTDGVKSHQLRDYASWLAKQEDECPLPRAMVFVSHITPPPEDFLGNDEQGLYHGLHRTSTSWGAVGRLIGAETDQLRSEHHAKALATAFLAYLKDKGMSNEFPSSIAFAAAEMYVSQADTLENLVDRMWGALKPVARFGKTADVKLQAMTGESSVSAWRYVMPGNKGVSGSFLQTGIWFPEAGELLAWSEDIAKDHTGAQAYVLFANDENDAFVAAQGNPNGFIRPSSDFLSCKPIAMFSSDPQTRGAEIITWVAAQGQELKAFLIQHELVTL